MSQYEKRRRFNPNNSFLSANFIKLRRGPLLLAVLILSILGATMVAVSLALDWGR